MVGVYDGLVDSSIFETEIRTYASGEADGIPFGKAVVLHDVTSMDIEAQAIDLPASAAEVASVIGISVRDRVKEMVYDENYALYELYSPVSVMVKGRMWVRVETEILSLARGVFVRHTCATPVLPDTCNGQFASALVDNDSGLEVAQTFTLTVATAAYTGLAVSVLLRNKVTGAAYNLSYAAADAATDDQDDVAGDLAALIDALDGIAATATGAVVTCTAANLGEVWEVACDARVTFADTTDSDYAVNTRAKWLAARTEGTSYYGLLQIL
jgi:hypothetical protein